MSRAVVRTESGSQKMPVIAHVGCLNVLRLPLSQRRSQRRQHFIPADRTITPALPVGQELKQTEGLENTTSSSCPSNAAHGRIEQHASSCVQEVNQLTAESDKNSSLPVDVDKRVLGTSTSPDTAGGVEGRTDADMGVAQKLRKRPAMSKSHSSPASITPGGVRDKLWSAKTRTLRSLSAAFPGYKRRGSKIEGSIGSASTTQPSVPSSVRDVPPQSETMQHGEKDISTTVGYAEDNQQKSVDAMDAEKTATESEEIEKLRRDLSDSYSQIADLQKRCEAQSRDLESSNSFLNTADKSSDTDVIHVLQRLNAEVQQNTTYMADCLAEGFEFRNVTTNPTKEQISAAQRASDYIGLVLVKSLETKSPEDIPMLLQIAFQAYFASVLCGVASSWAFEPGHNAFIDGIYQRLRRVEAQAISGRWRSLARVHSVQNWITYPESLVKGIITGISDILLAAGCTVPQPDMISTVTSKFEEKIALLVELAGRLNKMFDEVISSDFEVFVVQPGEKFEGKRMEDTDGGQAEIQEASVLCATHLGLIKRIPVGTLWEKGRKQNMTVLKAKVLLESFLNTED